jgi:hypothetical protein
VIVQEILKITRRRGMYWTALIVTTAIPVAVIVIDLILHGSKPESYTGGNELLSQTLLDLITLSAVVFSVLIGAQAGAWEFANRTFRYLVMSGRPRLLLYSVRVPALLAAVAIVTAPAALLAIAGSAVLPTEGAEPVTAGDAVGFLWQLWLLAAVFGFISFTIGALLQSVGAAIAVALLINFIGLNILAAATLISETLGDLMPPQLLSRLTGDDSSLSVPVSALALAVWLAALFAVGAARTIRSEY